MKRIEEIKLSKTISHALRHVPWEYELELDQEGWVSVDLLLFALQQHRCDWSELGREDLEKIVAESPKQRHEICGDRIRARYGHSVPGKLLKEVAEPPSVLYHGTPPKFSNKIKGEGLKPMQRQYVHLSPNIETAEIVGKRKGGIPIILKVRALDAYKEGVQFYRGNEHVWLADVIPPNFLEL